MAINKVVYGADTLLDLTEDTVTAEDVLNSKSFHTSDGVKRTGTASYPVTDVQVNGTSVMDGTVAKVEQPTADEQTATDEFTTINGGLLSSLKVALTPIQDLHGYDSPWVGGANVNKFPSAVAESKTVNGVTVVSDGHGTYSLSGTASADTNIDFDIEQAYTIPQSIGNGGQGCCYFFNNKTYSGGEFLFYFMDGTREVDSWSMTDLNRINSTYSAMSGQNCNKVRFKVFSGTNVDGLKISPMFSENGLTTNPFTWWKNICPISGHTEVKVGDDGKNLLNPSEKVIDSVYQLHFYKTNNYLFRSGFTYTIEYKGSDSDVRLYFAKPASEGGVYVMVTGTIASFTPEEDCYGFIQFTRTTEMGTLPSNTEYFLMHIGNGSQPYVPYNGYQVTVNLGGTYYSGILDVVTGVFTPDTAGVDLGTLTYSRTNILGVGYRYYMSDLSDIIKKPTDVSVLPNIVCEQYAPKLPSQYNQAVDGITVYTNGSIQIYDSTRNALSVSDFKTAMSGVQLVYELATPTPIQFSPTMVKALVGENHLSAPLDGQEITESKYRELFTFNEVEEIAQKIADSKIDNINTSYDTTFSSAFTEARYVKKVYEVPALTDLQFVLSGATSITFNHQLIISNTQTCCELIQFGSGARIGITDVSISQGSVTFTFDSALTKMIGFRCRITNDFVS